MAITVIPVQSLSLNTAAVEETALALDASLGGKLTPTRSNEKIMVRLINNDSGNATTCTIKAGNGYAKANADMSVALTASQVKVIFLETGAYLQVSGTYKGCILFEDSAADTKVVAYQLP